MIVFTIWTRRSQLFCVDLDTGLGLLLNTKSGQKMNMKAVSLTVEVETTMLYLRFGQLKFGKANRRSKIPVFQTAPCMQDQPNSRVTRSKCSATIKVESS